MDIQRNTPEQLILGDSPWSTGIALSLFVLILIGAGMMLWPNAPWLAGFLYVIGALVGFIGFVVFVNRVQVIMIRPERRLIIRRQSIFGKSAVEHDLALLLRADIDEHHSNSGGRPRILYRPTLVLRADDGEERIPMVDVYSNQPQVFQLVDAINEWLPAREN